MGLRREAPNGGFGVAPRESRRALRRDLLLHLDALDLPNGSSSNGVTKSQVRASHAFQRAAVFEREYARLRHKTTRLLRQFALGHEVRPDAIDPELVPVQPQTPDGDLFRFATLLWSIPVSRGYGRRMRYLVRDRSNGKLIGLFALADPVFNLRARDAWLGWDVNDRRLRLVNGMDAYIAGAVPPYSSLLGGKLVVSLIGSAEVAAAFAEKYGGRTGIIDGRQKAARLAFVMVTSALGRSSMYNRLVLRDPERPESAPLVRLVRVGTTEGFGHFQLSDELFARLRNVLREAGHPYVDDYGYGNGPNWRMRVIRAGLEELRLDQGLLKHGIAREVYVMPLASNLHRFLKGEDADTIIERPSIGAIAEAAKARWIEPRAKRVRHYRLLKRRDLVAMFAKPSNDRIADHG
jgi:hypothetical protein